MMNIIIVGRPNVGKSTLFNKLAQNSKAITHDTAGTTRDYKISKGNLGNIQFNITDTAGLYFSKKLDTLEQCINEQTIKAIQKADLVLFVVDLKSGFTHEDKNIAKFLRKHGTKVLLLINKCDNKKFATNTDDFFELGYKDICLISAEHGIGLNQIYDYIESNFEVIRQEEQQQDNEQIKLAIVGRPNAGKSTIINALLHKDRVITGLTPGITRDSIDIELNYRGIKIILTDTAGMRKRRNIEQDSIEHLSTHHTVDAIDAADIVALIIDSQALIEAQDMKIANLAINRGKPLILVVNKTDLIDSEESMDYIKSETKYLVETKLSEIKTLNILYVSGAKGKNVTKILDSAIKMYSLWNKKVTTSALNQWLQAVTSEHQLPLTKSGRRIKIKYITQVQTKPPYFKIFANNTEEIPIHYLKYLTNKLDEYFGFEGIPIKIIKAKSDNPYT